MANVMINTACNLRCPYCFAQESMEEANGISMTFEDFKTAVEFVLRTEMFVGVIGGEPLIHPKFEKFMRFLMGKCEMPASIRLFTNGLLLHKFRSIMESDRLDILVNWNHPDTVGSGYGEAYEEIVRLAPHKDIMLTLGYNLWETDPDFEYLIDTLVAGKFKRVRVSVVCPNSTDKRQVDAFQFYNEMKPAYLKLLRRLEEIRVAPFVDCNPIPSCVFTLEEREWLKQTFQTLAEELGMYSNVWADFNCNGGVVDIFPDLTAARCFGMGHIKFPIAEFDDVRKLRSRFIFEIESKLYHIPAKPECVSCKHHQQLSCSGGCYCFKLGRLDEVPNTCP